MSVIGEPSAEPGQAATTPAAATQTAATGAAAVTTGPRRGGRGPRGGGLRGREGMAGWLFVSPMILILGLFLVIPIVMALWVSLTNWNGSVDPFPTGPGAEFVGAKNYVDLIGKDGLTRSNFMQSIGNTFWYVLFVVPLQTVLALGLALLVNNRLLKDRSFFRTAFY